MGRCSYVVYTWFIWIENETTSLSEYVCPKCGHFNQSSRSKKEPIQSRSGSTTSPPILSPGLSAQPLSPASVTSDMPTVDGDDTMSMEVDTIQSKDSSTSWKTPWSRNYASSCYDSIVIDLGQSLHIWQVSFEIPVDSFRASSNRIGTPPSPQALTAWRRIQGGDKLTKWHDRKHVVAWYADIFNSDFRQPAYASDSGRLYRRLKNFSARKSRNSERNRSVQCTLKMTSVKRTVFRRKWFRKVTLYLSTVILKFCWDIYAI